MPILTERDSKFLQIVHDTPIEQLEKAFRACGVQEDSIKEFRKIADK